MAKRPPERWWSIRRAQNRKPATYRCPLCQRYLPALSEHILLVPEGDSSRRRHAHTACVMTARRAGRLPTRDEWLATQSRPAARGAARGATGTARERGPTGAARGATGRLRRLLERLMPSR